jgi:negative regulator of flagellin synthesis FlgM
MYLHGSTCLTGPVSRSRAWWQDGPGVESHDDSGGCLDLLPLPEESDLRLDLIARVRQEISAGTYDTPEKMEAALERLLERFDLA